MRMVSVRVNGILVQEMGKARLRVALPEEATVDHLLDALCRRHPSCSDLIRQAIPVIQGNHVSAATALPAGGDGSPVDLKSVNLTPDDETPPGVFEFDFLMSDVGLSEGDSFKYIVTILYPHLAMRFNEFHGVSENTYDENWPSGTATGESFTLKENDYNLFSTEDPTSVGLLGTQARALDSGLADWPFARGLLPLLLALLTVMLLLRRCHRLS